jgi:hypothetical protein
MNCLANGHSLLFSMRYEQLYVQLKVQLDVLIMHSLFLSIS